MVVLIDDAVDMTSTATVNMIGTALVYRRRKGIVHRQTSELEYRFL